MNKVKRPEIKGKHRRPSIMADLEFEELCAHIEDELGTATNGGTAAVTRNYK